MQLKKFFTFFNDEIFELITKLNFYLDIINFLFLQSKLFFTTFDFHKSTLGDPEIINFFLYFE